MSSARLDDNATAAHAETMRATPAGSPEWLAARDALVCDALPVARSVARQVARASSMLYDDALGAACEGLLCGAVRYRADRGPWRTAARVYASKAARMAARMDGVVRVSDRYVTERSRARRTLASMLAADGRAPTLDALAEAVELTTARVAELLAPPSGVSLDTPGDDRTPLGERMAAPVVGDAGVTPEVVRLWCRMLRALSPRDRLALRRWHGIGVPDVSRDEYLALMGHYCPRTAVAAASDGVTALRRVVDDMDDEARSRAQEVLGW
jgi:hypothetical protein